jgi:acyl-CoA-binding protein
MLDMKGRAKFDAWSKKKGMSKDDAMSKYIAFVDRLAG